MSKMLIARVSPSDRKTGKVYRIKARIAPKPKTITALLNSISEEICDHYCKYPEMYLPKNPGDDEDMLEEMMYTEICAKCPLVRMM